MEKPYVERALLGLILLIGLAAVDDAPRAAISIPDPSFRYETLKSKAPVEHTFRWVNTGSGVVELAQVMVPDAIEFVSADWRVLPGEEGRVTVQINPAHRAHKSRQSVRVQFRDRKLPPLTFEAVEALPDRRR